MKIVRYLIFSLIFPATLHASDTDSTLIRAERFYSQNEFTKALDQYKSLADSGLTSAALCYNIGNAYFKNHDIKSAILWYERAKRLAPGDEAIDFNLNLSRSLTFDKMEAVPELFLVTWGKAVRDWLTVRGWAWLGIWCFIVVPVFGLLYLFIRSLQVRRFSFGLGILCFVVGLTAFIFGYLQKINIERTDEAIVFAPSVTVKSSPDDSGNNLFILHEGTKVRIEDQIDEWREIRIPDGNKGWMRVKDLEII